MNRDPRWMWAGLALLFVIAIAWSLRGMEWGEEEVEVGATGPARRNPWYAVELLLNGRGVPALSSEALTDLPPTDHVVLWMARQPSSEDLGRLEGWVRSGGHLIAALPAGSALRALQQRENQEIVDTGAPEEEASDDASDGSEPEPEVEDEPQAEPEAEPEGGSDTGELAAPEATGRADPVDLNDPVLRLTDLGAMSVGAELGNFADVVPPQGGPPMRVEGLPWLRLVHVGARQLWPAPEGEVPGVTLAPIMRVQVDQGWVTLLVTSRPFNNSHLGEADHAALLWALVQRDGLPAGARLVVSAEPPSIWALLATYAWPALVSGGALLGLWLWATLPGFGPLLPDPSPHRRSLVEHVLATGELLWRLGHGDVLLKSARRAALREACGVSGPSVGPPGAALIEAVSGESGLSAETLRSALSGNATDPEHFVESARALFALRKSKRPSTSEEGA